jgi:DNA repair protein RecO (recombination protein O)
MCRRAPAPYRDKLLLLPPFLWRDEAASRAEVAIGLALTEHFLVHQLFAPQGRGLPEARLRFAERMRRPAVAGILTR